jgi:hypothetical protein
MKLTRELVSQFERHQAEAVESLLTESLRVPGNPEGYALYRDGPVRATLSTNPHAGWATQAYGVTRRASGAVRPVVEFFNGHRVPACIRVVPDGFTTEHADALAALGLRHVAFHTILWSPLPPPLPPPAGADVAPAGADLGAAAPEIREVVTMDDMDAHIDIQLGAYGVPPAVIDRLRPLRRMWLGTPGRRFYLAFVDGRPVAQAILQWRDDIAYLESAGTRHEFRGRGLQQSLIRRRIADATREGCRLIIGGADFGGSSVANQMACGLAVAYTAARWVQRPEAMLPLAAS